MNGEFVNLKELPFEHELRNQPLAAIGVEYKINGSKIWAKVLPSYGIAKKTFNDLGDVWTTWDEWRVPS